jgi:ectoine hydroxylase-related dioxygenase (phytanoyl-CoA dioxygenase family)
MQSYLTPDLLNEFLENGYVVIENVLTNEQIDDARDQLHNYIEKYKGVSHYDILSNKTTIKDVRKSGLTSELFYSKFKMDIHLNECMYATFKEICEAIDPTCKDVVPYIDRVCYRLPDKILAEGGLNLHIDRNPWDTSKAKKIRSVQAFVTLTHHLGAKNGGLCVVPQFQSQFDEYFAKSYNKTEADLGGEFYRMHGLSHSAAQNRLKIVQAAPGSLIIWDNRLPHATCNQLAGPDTREVIYLTYLPANIEKNIKYWKEQSKNFVANIPPPSYNENNNEVDRDYEIDELNEFQKQMLGI